MKRIATLFFTTIFVLSLIGCSVKQTPRELDVVGMKVNTAAQLLVDEGWVVDAVDTRDYSNDIYIESGSSKLKSIEYPVIDIDYRPSKGSKGAVSVASCTLYYEGPQTSGYLESFELDMQIYRILLESAIQDYEQNGSYPEFKEMFEDTYNDVLELGRKDIPETYRTEYEELLQQYIQLLSKL